MLMRVALAHMEAERDGLAVDSYEFKKRLEAVTPRDPRFHRRPRPLNHLMPPREGTPRQRSDTEAAREQERQALKPRFEQTPKQRIARKGQHRRSEL